MSRQLGWRDVILCLLAGAIGGGVFAALTSVPGVRGGLSSISAGEWLQACASIIGVALTVWAALWLERHRREAERKNEQRLIDEALILLEAVLPSASNPIDENWPLQKRTLTTLAHFEMVRTGLTSLSFARESYRIRSYNLWNALHSIDTIISLSGAKIGQEEAIVRGDTVTDAVLAIAREHIQAYACDLVQPVVAARAALKHEQG